MSARSATLLYAGGYDFDHGDPANVEQAIGKPSKGGVIANAAKLRERAQPCAAGRSK
jgi:hypothetical protein